MSETISSKRLGQMMQTVLAELRDIGEPTRVSEILSRAAPKLNLTDHENGILEKTGYIRWESLVHWASVDCVKAGFITKSGGKWSLTPQGAKALSLPPEEFIRIGRTKYAEWRKSRHVQRGASTLDIEAVDDGETDEEAIIRQTTYAQAIEESSREIERFIGDISPYTFQQLVAELLVGMGYYVPYVAPPGPDGGVDIVAYKDPLGTSTPRIRCQVKHRTTSKVSVAEVRALAGILHKDGDMGLIVSYAGFTADAERELRASSKHIETIDLDRLVELWKQHYDKITERGKALLPLVKVFFLAPTEE